MQSDTLGAEVVADDEWLPLNPLLPYMEALSGNCNKNLDHN